MNSAAKGSVSYTVMQGLTLAQAEQCIVGTECGAEVGMKVMKRNLEEGSGADG